MDSIANTSWAEYTSSTNGMGPVPYISTAAFAIFIFLYLFHRPSDSKLPLINHGDTFDLGSSKLRRDFVVGGWQMMQNALKTYSEKPFRVFSDFGEVTILPTRYANEIRNAENLSFSKWTYNTFHADLPGFEGFREGSSDSRIIQEVIKTKLTQSLAKATLPLSEESDASLQEIFTDSKEWHDLPLRKAILQLVARLSSRVFLGEELCRDPAWLQITIAYTINAFAAATELRIWPRPLRPIVHWFLPSCRKLRAQVKEARSILTPVLEKRRQMKAARNDDFVAPNDAIEWFEEKARKDGTKYDPAIAQLLLSVAAIHTTSDLITQAMFDLAQNPNMIEPLRKEMIDVLGQDGWQKTSLYKLKLLDSVLKETQRLKPIGMISMRRVVMSPMTLSDGLKLAPNSTIAISTHRLRDPEVHENPEEFDGYRWYRMREIPGKENVAQLASTSADHLAFGHGKHACPGRFFAANEAKIALAHLLLKYDWKLADGVKPQVAKTAFSLGADPFAKVSIRRRQEEINL